MNCTVPDMSEAHALGGMQHNTDRGRGRGYQRGSPSSRPRRGRGQGRGGFQRGRGGYNGGREEFPKHDIMEDLRPSAVQTIEVPRIAEGEADVDISDVKSLASYNYTKTGPPTMIVPGT